MSRLFGRRARVIAGVAGGTGVEIDTGGSAGLRVVFRVEKTSAPLDPNTCEVTIHNLAQDTRGRLDGDKTPRVRLVLEAGYGADIGAVFVGETVSIAHKRTRLGWETTLRAGDLQRVKTVTINESFAAGAGAGDILRKVLGEVGEKLAVDTRQALAQVRAGDSAGAWRTFTRGLSLTGGADVAIAKVLAGTQYQLLVDGDELHILAQGDTRPGEAVVLSQDTGLVGSPEIARDEVLTVVGEVRGAVKAGKLDPASSGVPVIKATSLLNARLSAPGALVQLVSRTVNGNARVIRAVTTGDTHEGAWTTEIQARAL